MNTLTSRGLEEPAHALRGLEEPFSSCAVVSVFGSGGKTKKSSSRLSGGCGIIIMSGKKKVLVFCLAGAQLLLRPELKKSSSRLSGRCGIVITSGKKKFSRLSGGCAIVITSGKRKSSSPLSGGCAIIITSRKKMF